MGTLTLNNTFEIEYPDDFHVLTGEERSRMNFAKEGEGECLEAKDRHIIISIAWQKLGGFTDLMLNSRDFAKNVRGSIRKLDFCAIQERSLEERGERYCVVSMGL